MRILVIAGTVRRITLGKFVYRRGVRIRLARPGRRGGVFGAMWREYAGYRISLTGFYRIFALEGEIFRSGSGEHGFVVEFDRLSSDLYGLSSETSPGSES